MALTMTRTRTQTTLTRLAKLLANLNGELEFVQQLIQENPEYVEALLSRQKELADGRAAVCATINQFDPDVDCTLVASSNDWSKAYRRQGRSLTAAYTRELLNACQER